MGKWLRDRTIATERDCNLKWCGRRENFRCGLCGHKFVPGDGFQMLYTNNLSGYGGNPLMCDDCNKPDAIDKWKLLWDGFNSIVNSPKYWRMKRDLTGE